VLGQLRALSLEKESLIIEKSILE
jgi:chromosome segregation ATPase